MKPYEIAPALLQSVVDTYADALTQEGNAADALPSKQMVALGTVSANCPQLVVSTTRFYIGTPTSGASIPGRSELFQTTQVLSVRLHRCVPSPSEQTGEYDATAVSAASQVLLADPPLLIQAARAFASSCDQVVIGDLTSIGPSGGLVGWALEVRAQVS